MPAALGIVQKFFPNVEKVVDGTKSINITVSNSDNKKATKKNHSSCVLANCTKDQEKADGVIVSIRTVYVIKGNRAFRYATRETTSREIVSFDREGGFEPGEYTLVPPGKGHQLGNRSGRKHKTGTKDGSVSSKRIHRTTNIRTSLTQAGG